MIKNFWQNKEFYCMNHKTPVPMKIRDRHTPLAVGGGNTADYLSTFYACPKYMAKDEKNPDGHEANEPACGNTLSFAKAEEIIQKFSAIVEEDRKDGVYANYTNLVFTCGNIDVKILEAKDGKMKIGILNKGALR